MRKPSEASKQMTADSNRLTPQEEQAQARERARTLELQNQPHTYAAQEWMRSRGVTGNPGSREWREGRAALLQELGVGRFPGLRSRGL